MTEDDKKKVPTIDAPIDSAPEDKIGEYQHQVVNDEKGIEGDKTGITARVTFIVSFMWAIFQMSTASWLLLDSLFVKAIHLAFAMALIFLNLPALKTKKEVQQSYEDDEAISKIPFLNNLIGRWDLRILLAMSRVTVLDWIFGICAVAAALYIMVDYVTLVERMLMMKHTNDEIKYHIEYAESNGEFDTWKIANHVVKNIISFDSSVNQILAILGLTVPITK